MAETHSILYIGEDPTVMQILERIHFGRVEQCSNGLSASQWLTYGNFNPFTNNELNCPIRHPELIVCESNLPGSGGIALYKEFKKKLLIDNQPFILISNRFNYDLREAAKKEGIQEYFGKPLNEALFQERLRYFFDYYKPSEQQDVEAKNNADDFLIPYKTPLIKRLFDVIMSSIVLLMLSPILLLVAIAIKIESKGPIVYKSKRVGSNFKIFNFLKFRSMYPDADKRLKEVAHLNQYQIDEVELVCKDCAKLPEGKLCSPAYYYDGERICENMAIKRKKAKKAFLKIQNDPRVTKVGNFIRNTSIDELPQLINVLKGDMSIVGNRPLPLNEAYAITKSKWGRRFRAAAGLTGLWQVELRGKGGIMSEEERFMLDNQYAENNSFIGDIKLILRTIPALLQKGNV
jgi:lipopolysaccharide/colanic/teichoic acid biosynthesis glycosyltransferase